VGDIPVAKPSPIPRTLRFPRRGLAIALVLAGFVGLVVVAALAAYPTGSNVDQITVPQWVTVARANDLQPDQPVGIFAQKIWLVKLDSGEVLALSYKSPFRGCTVPWRPDFVFHGIKGWFRDPCQSATFDLTGACFAAPCPRGMDRYPVQVVGGKVQVKVGTGALISGPPVNFGAKPYVPANH
jgi:nitrite reductase/ring-hydroxylating ferredoxin subunit